MIGDKCSTEVSVLDAEKDPSNSIAMRQIAPAIQTPRWPLMADFVDKILVRRGRREFAEFYSLSGF